eukprot:Em0023g402a
MSRQLKPRNSTAVFISTSFPWVNTLEWDTVYDWLYSEEVELRKRAVGRVAAWKARASVPLCIELTADLVESGIWELQHYVKGATEQPLTLMYSMALTRFTNGVSELAGGKFAFPSSDMVTIVGKLNVPSWVVELRHDGTHAYLPSLSLFHKGAEFALGWLKTYYWGVQRQLNTVGVSPLDSDLRMRRRRSYGEPNGTNATKDLGGHRMFSTLSTSEEELISLREELLVYMGQLRLQKKVKPIRLVKCLASSSCSTMKVVLEEGLFLAFPDNVEHLVVYHSTLEDLPVLLVQASELTRCWVRVLRLLGQQDSWAKSRVLHALVVAMHGPYCSLGTRELLAAWAGVLLDEHNQLTEENELLFPGTVDWGGLLATLSENPGLYSYPLVLQIIKHYSLPRCTAERVLQIMKLVTCSERGVVTCSEKAVTSCSKEAGSIGPHSEVEMKDEEKKGTDFAQLEMMVKRGREKREAKSLVGRPKETRLSLGTQPRREKKSQPAHNWELVEDPVAWIHCPLGVCPSQVIMPSLLELPEDLDCSASLFKGLPEILGTSDDTSPPPLLPVDIENWPQSIPTQDIGAIRKSVALL